MPLTIWALSTAKKKILAGWGGSVQTYNASTWEAEDLKFKAHSDYMGPPVSEKLK